MPEIHIEIRNKIARLKKPTLLVCDNSDYVAVFDFDEEWSLYETKTARFVVDSEPTDVVFSGDRCAIPPVSDTTLLEIGVFAGDIHTTTPVSVRCLKSITSGIGAPAAPSDDVYNQIMEKLNDLNELSDEELAEAIEAYFGEHPVSVTTPDWAENDETSPNYVQNRTHWSAEGGAELVPKQTAEVTLNSAVYRKMSSLEINESAAAPIIGSAAIVSFDGVDYVVTVNPYSTNSLRIGNERLGNYPNNTEQGDGEPFLIELFTNDDGVIAAAYLMVVYHDSYQETHTVTVRTAETVHQLSEKYIPAEILRIRDIPAWALAVEKPTYTAEDVGAAGKVKMYYSITNSTAYTPVAAMANDNAPYIVITTAVQSSVMSAYNTTLLFYPYNYSSGSYYGLALRDGKVYGYACHNAGIVYTLITNVVTVVDNLTTDDASKALSAAQGKALKALIDNIDTSGSGGSASSDGSVVTFTAVATGTTNGSSVVFDELTDGQTAYDAVKAAYSAGKEVLLNVTNSAGDWDTILRISKVNSNDDTVMFSNAEICETGEANPADEEMHLQWVVLKSDSTAAYYYVEPASGGASDDKSLGIASATVGQIARITAVDDNGAPTVWEAVDLPSGSTADIMTVSETILASGTIAGGSAAVTMTDTGLTVDELRKWKIFVFGVTGAKDYYGLVIGDVSYINRLCWEQSTTMQVHFEWLDTAQTTLRLYVCHGGGYSNLATNVGFLVGGADNMYVKNFYGKVAENGKVSVLHYSELESDTKWTIKGILRYGE